MTLKPSTIAAAQAADRHWRLPASVSLAQFGVESAWGAKEIGWNLTPPVHTFNFFGMKAVGEQPCIVVPTHEVYHGQSVLIRAAFRTFTDEATAFDAHGQLIATAPVYAAAFDRLPDLTTFVRLMAAHYATDPHYADLILAIIREDDLGRYDTPAPAKAA